MVVIKRIGSIKIIMRTRDHWPVHLHIENGGNEAKVSMLYVWEIKKGRFTTKQMEDVNKYIEKNKDEIKNQYKKLKKKGVTPKKIG